MDEFLDMIYKFSEMKQSDMESNTKKILDEKDKLESAFSNLLLENQEIAFDNYMDSLDKCNNELNLISFNNGFSTALLLISKVIKIKSSHNE